MNLYTKLSVASSAVSFGTVALLLWNTTGKSNMSYIYLSLVPPTIILAYHLLYLFDPFLALDTASYHVISESAPTPASREDSRIEDARTDRPKLFIRTSVSTTSEERNPMVSSTLSILCLVLFTVLVGAIAISAGTVALLNAVEEASLEKAVERLETFASLYNTTAVKFEAGIDIANATIKPELAPIAAKMTRKTLAQIFGDVVEISRSREAGDRTVPSSLVLAGQAVLSLAQMLLLGKIVLIGMRRRVSRYAYDHDEDEEEYEFRWAYVEDDADSANEEDALLPNQGPEHFRDEQATMQPNSVRP